MENERLSNESPTGRSDQSNNNANDGRAQSSGIDMSRKRTGKARVMAQDEPKTPTPVIDTDEAGRRLLASILSVGQNNQAGK